MVDEKKKRSKKKLKKKDRKKTEIDFFFFTKYVVGKTVSKCKSSVLLLSCLITV